MNPSAVTFGVCAAVVVYVVAGYPVILAGMAWRRPRPVRKTAELRPVSVVIAVRNGAPWIGRKLESVLELDYPRELLEVVVVSDGSEDATDEIVRTFACRGVRLIRVRQGGKPAALNAAVPETRNEILLLTDVRQEIEPGSLRRLVECFGDPEVGAVSGELLIREGETSGEQNVGLYWRYETWIRGNLSRVDSMLGATGPFYAMRRELFVPMPPDTLLDDMYLPLAAFFRGYRLVMEDSARAIDYPTTLGTEFRRKVRTLAGNYQLMRFYPKLFGLGNRMWFHYISYKFGRLVLPWVLLGAGVSSFWLPGAWAAAAVAGQGVFYGLAALDGILPEGSAVKRASSPSRTFVTMMAAAVWALRVFFVPPQRLWTPTQTKGAAAPGRPAGS